MKKVLYLFNQPRIDDIKMIERGERSDGHLYGMRVINKYGIDAGYIEIEKYFPLWFCVFLRKHILNIYLVHLPLFLLFFKYDIVFSPTAFGSLFLKSLLFMSKPKWVVYDFSIVGLIGKGQTLKERIFRWMISKTDGIITLCEKEAELLREMFPSKKDKICFIPYSVDDSFFKPQNLNEGNNILSVGIDVGRDHKTLLEACKDIDTKVVISGDQKKFRKLGELPSNIKAVRFDPLELLRQYEIAKIIVIPLDITGGKNDAMGCSTLVEAMIMGKAIIVTRTPTMESYIDNMINGILVNQGDSEDMKDAILYLLNNEEKRKELGKKAREFALKNLTKGKGAEMMASYFKSFV